MTHAEAPRYEVKMPCPLHYLHGVSAWVRLDSAHWYAPYPQRQINNIYFDTPDCQNLNENLAGSSDRSKLRLRWYGSSLNTISRARLELKYREGAVIWKAIWPLDVTADLSGLSWSAVCRLLREAADVDARLLLNQPVFPALINSYRRRYYVTRDRTVRLTIDTDIKAYYQRSTNRPNLRRPVYVADHAVVELKAATDNLSYERLAEVIGRFPLRPDRHSKYAQGMLAAPDFEGVELL
ncbi:MAG: VTC domain-containing protein [Chloroflexi bacterium]|nr:VTC domain-containing protein [Chloroflexota bacterium]